MFTEKQIFEISGGEINNGTTEQMYFIEGFKKAMKLIKLPNVDDYIKWCAPSIHKNEDGNLLSKEWIEPDCQDDFNLFEEFMNEWKSKLLAD